MKVLNDKYINQQGFLDHRTEFLITLIKEEKEKKSRLQLKQPKELYKIYLNDELEFLLISEVSLLF